MFEEPRQKQAVQKKPEGAKGEEKGSSLSPEEISRNLSAEEAQKTEEKLLSQPWDSTNIFNPVKPH
jgi:hypothetical protein